MTPLEKEALETAQVVLKTFTKARVTSEDLIDTLGKLRDLVKHLENKSYGCSTGTHAGKCLCKPALICRATEYDKYLKRQIKGGL